MVDVGICYPDIVLAFKLLKQTNLPAERRSLIIAALHSYLEEDRSRNLLQEAIGSTLLAGGPGIFLKGLRT